VGRALLLILCVSGSAGAVEWAGDWTVYGQVFDRVERDRPDDLLRINEDLSVDVDGYFTPRLDDAVALRFLGVSGTLYIDDWLDLRAALDSGGVRFRDGEVTSDGLPFDEAARETGFVRIAWAEATWGPVSVGVGKRNLRVGAGLLYDEYATGVGAAVAALDFRLEGGVWLLGREWVPSRGPMVQGKLSYGLDLTNEVYFFGAVITDDAAAAEELSQVIIDGAVVGSVGGQPGGALPLAAVGACARLDGEARPWIVGTGANLLFGAQRLTLVAALGRGFGTVDIQPDFQSDPCNELLAGLPPEALEALVSFRDNLPFGERKTDLESFALDGTWRIRATSWLYPGATVTWLSGNDSNQSIATTDDAEVGTLGVFLAAAPWLPRSSLFFGTGLGTGFETRSATAAGVLGRGVVATALTVLFVPHDRVELELRAVWLEADQTGRFSDDKTYGQEYDTSFRWDATDAMRVELAYDVMRVGPFYPEQGWWWRVTAGLAAVYPP
jgi:hypothetical protein